MKKGTTDKKILFHIFNALLNNNEINKRDLLDCLKINESTFYKHLSDIKKAGFTIRRKEKDIYKLTKYQEALNLAKYEISVLLYLMLVSDAMLPTDKTNLFLEVIDKILSLTTEKNTSEILNSYETNKKLSISSTYSDKTEILNQYLNTNKKITIILTNSKEINITPLEIYWKKEKLHLKYADEKEDLNDIHLNKIIKIIDNKKFIKPIHSNEVIFELYGKLAQSYLLKENERIVRHSKNKIVVANSEKDKNKLFRRLLRYDVLCKVTFPKADVEEFEKMIKNSLDNIL